MSAQMHFNFWSEPTNFKPIIDTYAPLAREPKLADRRNPAAAIPHHSPHLPSRRPAPVSERELGARLGVSRTVVREALRALSTKGLVEVRDGAGAYVRAPSTDLVSELLGICVSHMETGDVTSGHILEMRRILEIEMSGLAAERSGANHAAQYSSRSGLRGRPLPTRLRRRLGRHRRLGHDQLDHERRDDDHIRNDHLHDREHDIRELDDVEILINAGLLVGAPLLIAFLWRHRHALLAQDG